MNKSNEFPSFNRKVGDSIGRGKDSVVVPFKGVDTVLKWNHDPKTETTKDEHFNKLLYKRKKYEMLSFFLRDFIPKSDFVLGNKLDGEKNKIKEYTLQKRVHNATISSLSDEQKKDPRFLQNLHLLIQKLIEMHKILKEVNDSIKEGKLDLRLDLGGLSKSIKELIREDMNFNFISLNKDFMNSPNLLVDPESMKLSLVDFGAGEWSNEKEATLILVKALTKQNKKTMELIKTPQI